MQISEFTRLGRQHLPDMEAHALRLTRNQEEARDLLQESAYWAYRNWESFQPGSNFRAWALTIIRNTFLSDYRALKRRRELLATHQPDLSWGEPQYTHNPAEGSLGAEKIMEEINELPTEFRRPFLLHFDGLKYREISLRMGIPVGTAKSRVFTAKKMLQQRMSNLYGDLS